jgi:hypothetical protein
MINLAGQHCDNEVRQELMQAGINIVDNGDLVPGEPKTSLTGELHGWTFKRAWYYWIASGPALPFKYADAIHEVSGKDVRVAGHCGCPSPREWYGDNAFGVSSYHVDTQDGLNLLAASIKRFYQDTR